MFETNLRLDGKHSLRASIGNDHSNISEAREIAPSSPASHTEGEPSVFRDQGVEYPARPMPSDALMGKTVLVTGGTGSFPGSSFITRLLRDYEPAAIRVFSRDELKQHELAQRLGGDNRLRFLIGDVRDLNRVVNATRGVDVIVHAAALKQVPACEYNPFEAVQTNVIGAENIVTAAIENGVGANHCLEHRQGGEPGQSLRSDEALF